MALGAGLSILVLYPAPANAAKCSADSFINKVSKQMLRAGKSGSSRAFHSLIRSHADVTAITTFALGKYNKSVPRADRNAVQKQVVVFMSKTMAQYGRKFKGDVIKIQRCSKSGKGLKVDSLLVQPNRRTQKFIWKLNGSGRYKIRDLSVQGVWLVPLMRTSFQKAIKNGGGKISALYSYLGVNSKMAEGGK